MIKQKCINTITKQEHVTRGFFADIESNLSKTCKLAPPIAIYGYAYDATVIFSIILNSW